QDHQAVRWAITVTGLQAFADRDVAQLSGGERQRAWIALALAQDTPLLFLDEPTTYLDIGYQLEVLHLVQALNREHGITVVMVLHDLNQAAAYADRIVCLHDGTIVADGAPNDVITPELLHDVFRVNASIVQDPVTGRPVFLAHNPVSGTPDVTSKAAGEQ
ncbi:MAG: ABC transporter ATP-binding protein, partial [Microbacterium sp.]